MYKNIIEIEEVRVNKGKRCYFQLLIFLAFVKSHKRYFWDKTLVAIGFPTLSFWKKLKRNETGRYQSAQMRFNRTRLIVMAWSFCPKLKENTITRVILITWVVIPGRLLLLCSQSTDQYIYELLYGTLMIISW